MKLKITDRFSSQSDVTLYRGDRLDLLNQIRKAGISAQLIITSPPYNVGKEYEELVDLDTYIKDQKDTIAACLDILSPTGSICWQVGHYIEGSGKNKEAFPLDIVLYPIFKEFGLRLRNRVVWHFGHGLHETFRFTGRHETMLWFTRPTTEYLFSLDPIRIPQKYPGKRAYRGPNKGQLTGNPNGKNPSDVWDMPNVKANHIEKVDHPCQFPVGLVERMLLATTNVGDLVVDPYLGVGTTAVASVLRGRKAAGADISDYYLSIAKDRIISASKGKLKTRPLDKPVYEPDENSSLTKIPDEWINKKGSN